MKVPALVCDWGLSQCCLLPFMASVPTAEEVLSFSTDLEKEGNSLQKEKVNHIFHSMTLGNINT